MSQISPPIRIVLVAAVVFLAAWFTVLKPKEVDLPPEPAAAATATGAPQSAAGKFKATAKAGAATAEGDAAGAANANLEGGATAPATAPSTAPSAVSSSDTGAATATRTAAPPTLPALSAAALKSLPGAVRSGLKSHKVVVLGVVDTVSKPWAPMADDDQAVHRALRHVNRYDGRVVVRSVPIARLAKYEGVLKALNVSQSPTVVIIDRERQAVALPGYVDRNTINQAIADARRYTPAKKVKADYRRRTNALCGRYTMRMDRLGVRGAGAQRAEWSGNLSDIGATYARAFGRIPAPARHSALRSKIVAAVRADVARARAAGHPPYRGVLAGLSGEVTRAGLTACAAVRTR